VADYNTIDFYRTDWRKKKKGGFVKSLSRYEARAGVAASVIDHSSSMSRFELV
jgi:hypothetical protein